MKRRILSVFALAILLASCSSTYRQAQTPDDVYFSPGKEKVRTYASADNNRQYDRYSRNNSNNNYDDYTSSSEDDYLRMKIQNRYRWGSLDDYDYWYSPNYALNNYYAYNSFNPLLFNSWGLNYYYSPFASIQPYGWFSSYYPTYGYYTPYSGYYGHNYGYGYTPVFLTDTRRTANNVHRPLLGGYVNNNYNNNNNRNRVNGRYIPAFNNDGSRFNNRNNGFNNNNNFNRSNSNFNNNNNSNSAPVRSFTPSSSSSSSSSGGGGVTRQPRH